MSRSTECVKVVVRCRPLSERELQDGRQRIIEMDATRGQVMVRNPKSDDREPPKTFTYDQVYDWHSEQATIFDTTARPIVDACMGGYNGTIFAYGQTGTGKSFTMEGRDEPPELRGIIPATFAYVFDTIARQAGSKEFLVRVSYLEIYNEEIRDLLSRSPQARLELKEHPDRGVYVRDLMQCVVKSAAEIGSVLQVGKKNRVVGATLMNQDSSRSHSVFTLTIEATARDAGGDAAGDGDHIRVGKLNLVDLAGSERQSKTGATGDRLKEGIKINLSLTALGNVISALVDGKSGHVPYRDSKLTRLLADSLGGNTKTVMVANIGPADWNYDETVSTLRYAHRAKSITNKPRINEDPKDAMLREFQDEIARLKAELAARQGSAAAAAAAPGQVLERIVEVEPDKVLIVAQLREQVQAELEARQQQLEGQALEAARQEAEARARQQLESLMVASNATEEQRRALREDLRRQIADMRALEAAAAAGRAEQQQLLERLAALQSKVLHGGENLLDKVSDLKARSAATKTELEVAARQQQEAQRRLEQLQLERLDLDKQYTSLEEEVSQKGRQLASLYERYRSRRAEAGDLTASFQSEREDLLADYRGLSQALKLKTLVIDSFIPAQYQDLIASMCEWREYEEAWAIAHAGAAGNPVRAERDAARARDATSSLQVFDIAAIDAERLQQVYITTTTASDSKTACTSGVHGNAGSSGGGSAGAAASTWRPGRPTSARRTSNQAVLAGAAGTAAAAAAGGARPGALGATIGMRPGSAAARRTRELLSAAVGSPAVPSLEQNKHQRPGSSVLAGRILACGGSGAAAVGAAEPTELPRARGLVRGSTDAFIRSCARPPSAQGR